MTLTRSPKPWSNWYVLRITRNLSSKKRGEVFGKPEWSTSLTLKETCVQALVTLAISSSSRCHPSRIVFLEKCAKRMDGFRKKKLVKKYKLTETNISHLGKRRIIDSKLPAYKGICSPSHGGNSFTSRHETFCHWPRNRFVILGDYIKPRKHVWSSFSLDPKGVNFGPYLSEVYKRLVFSYKKMVQWRHGHVENTTSVSFRTDATSLCQGLNSLYWG